MWINKTKFSLKFKLTGGEDHCTNCNGFSTATTLSFIFVFSQAKVQIAAPFCTLAEDEREGAVCNAREDVVFKCELVYQQKNKESNTGMNSCNIVLHE